MQTRLAVEGFYVYIWVRANGVPCYVGKGYGDRWKKHQTGRSNNRHLRNILKKDGNRARVEIISVLNEPEAFELERFLISDIGKESNGGPLINIADGGEGPFGMTHTEEVKRLVGEKSRSMWSDPGKRAQIIEAQIKGRSTEDYRARRREISRRIAAERAMRRKPRQLRLNLRVWKSPTEETRRKISAALMGMKRSPESKVKMSAWQIGRKMSPDAREKMRQAKLRAKLRAMQEDPDSARVCVNSGSLAQCGDGRR